MRMKARKIILFVLCACLLSSPLKVYAQAGPNLSSDTSVEAYISLLDADGVPTDIFYCAGGVVSETSKVDGAYYEQSANTLYLSGFSTEQTLECSDMGDDFKIHVTGDCFVGQITIWGDGYGGSLSVEGSGTLSVNRALSYTEVPAMLLRADGAGAFLSVSDSAKVILNGLQDVGSLAILSTTIKEPLAAVKADIDESGILANQNADATYDYQISAPSITLSAKQTVKENQSVTEASAVSLKKTKVKSVTAKKKTIILKWKKISNASYYQVQISTNAKFKKAVVKKSSVNSLKITKLTGKTTYYIRVRSCTTVNGKTIVSAWSKKIKTKTK